MTNAKKGFKPATQHYLLHTDADISALLSCFAGDLIARQQLSLYWPGSETQTTGLAGVSSFRLFVRKLSAYIARIEAWDAPNLDTDGFVEYATGATTFDRFQGYISPVLKLKVFFLAPQLFAHFKENYMAMA